MDQLVGSLAESLDLSSDELIRDLSVIFSRYDSVEYPLAAYEVCLGRAVPPRDARYIASRAASRYWDAASAALTAYPTVEDTLRHLHYEGVTIVGVTDAPLDDAFYRLALLGLSRFFAGVAGRPAFPRRPAVAASFGGGRSKRLRTLRRTTRWHLDGVTRKPNPIAYATVLRALGAAGTQAIVVGDSVERDLLPAAVLGVQPLLARYGKAETPPELLQRLVPTFHPDFFSTPRPVDATIVPIDTYRDVISWFPIQQVLAI